MQPVQDTNVASYEELPSPRDLRREIPLAPSGQHSVIYGRQTVQDILSGADPRLMVIVGPCTIHDPEGAGLEFARRLANLSDELSDQLVLVMRVCFAKPRPSPDGWTGLVNDPDLDASFHVDKGLRMARRFLVNIVELGMPVGIEFVNPNLPQYVGDLVSWAGLGSRTLESATFRDLASGLSMPVGFKNDPDGGIETAIAAIHSAMRAHKFVGLTEEGRAAIVSTRGNNDPHLILRGGLSPNYGSDDIASILDMLARAKATTRILIDCAHANSEWDPRNQGKVFRDGLSQIEAGNLSIAGFLLESHLNWGKQPILRNRDEMEYGVSVTDACIDWTLAEELLREAHERYGAAIERLGDDAVRRGRFRA